jgi:hypothetical protein
MGRQRSGWPAVVAFFSLLAGIATLSVPAASHDWYSMECCSGTDCAVVEHATYAHGLATGPALPVLTVTTRHGTAVVPPNFPRKESKDGEMHACIRPVRGVMKLICLFVPPPSWANHPANGTLGARVLTNSYLCSQSASPAVRMAGFNLHPASG